MDDPLELPNFGIHQALPRVARRLQQSGFTAEEVIIYLTNQESALRRPYQLNEVQNAVALVYGTRSTQPVCHAKRKASRFNADKLARLAANLPEVDAAWFKTRSPIAVDKQTPDTFLHSITNTGESILCFTNMRSRGQYVWVNRNDANAGQELCRWRKGLTDGGWFLPQPVTGDWIECERLQSENNPRGRSRRSEECVTAFRFALLESDVANPAHWLAALAQLPLPIASIVTSGGKSIHALVLVNATSKREWDKTVRGELLPFVVPLGADPAALTAVRLTRLPFIHRGGQLQELLYLNPEPTSEPIANLPNLL